MKFRPMGAELFHTDMRTGGQKGMAELIVASRGSANAPKNLAQEKWCLIVSRHPVVIQTINNRVVRSLVHQACNCATL
jgi:hypothetical protein